MDIIEYITKLEQKCNEIQANYKFDIPDYILIEIAQNRYKEPKFCLFINMAILNNRLTKKQGKILKKEYYFNKDMEDYATS